jgi:uncharacterized protein (TIGR02466 family)
MPHAEPLTQPRIHLTRQWPTVLYQADMPDPAPVNRRLRALIVDAARTDTSASLAVIAARKSSPDLLQWDDPAVTALRTWILAAVTALTRSVLGDLAGQAPDVVAEAWAVVYQDGGSHRVHTHHDACWSGVYYVDTAGLAPGTGQIQFVDPRPAAIARHASTAPVHSIQPRPGLLVAFPSWLPHLVQATRSTRPRICIAFNAAYQEPEPRS